MRPSRIRFPGTPYIPAATYLLRPLRYGNGNPALVLQSNDGGDDMATLSVNPPGPALQPGLIAIKDWSENEGVAASLVGAEVIFPGPVEHRPSGFVSIGIYRLTPEWAVTFAREEV